MTPAEAQAHLRTLLADAKQAADTARKRAAHFRRDMQRARFAADAQAASNAEDRALVAALEHGARAEALYMAIEVLGS